MHSNPGKKICPSSDLNNFREENKAVGEVSKLGAKSGKVSSGLSEVSVATANNATTEEGQKQSSDDVFHMRGVLHNLRLSGKENSGLTWQRVQDVKTVATGASSMKGYPRAQRQNVVACKEAQRSGAFKVLGLPQKTSHHKLGQPHCFEENRERRSSGRLDHSPKWVNVQQSREELPLSKLSFCRPQSQEAAVLRRGNHSEGGPTHEWGKSTVGSASTRPSLTIPTHLPVREVKASTPTFKTITNIAPSLRRVYPSVSLVPERNSQEEAHGRRLSGYHPSVDLAGHPDASLAHVWSWYEEPGAYGLGVRAEPSQNSKNWGSGGFPFHAYFVPSLSAVQLFSHPRDNNVGVKKTQEGRRWPDSSYAEDTLPSCCEVEAPDDSVLLFEYFEHERPDQRKPFCAK
ncbi:unnamed protein product [Spirodela intermedia]|uniref:Uncharacterized protein n=1 Tax=Spirodela intermedia TaxID=51605 RepID=A0A7I8IIB7_SPIIN|nr:unnamed protein product [Spirodela intermedia]CAA6656632.1 unnamed protein product [Spirodela intermedia]